MRPMVVLMLLGSVAAVTACGDGSLTSTELATPATHRATAAQCTGTRPAGSCPANNAGTCRTDADCTSGTNGRCELGGRVADCGCTYDACNADTDCAANQVCRCGGSSAAGRSANVCVEASCRIDSDCGAGEYCTPSLDPNCGAYFGVTRYACTTPKDTCRNDIDCGGGDGGTTIGFCAYRPELGLWQCSYSLCAG